MRRILIALVCLALIAAAAGWLLTAPKTLSADEIPAHAPDLANGERLFYAGGCASCHAAPGAKGEAKLDLVGGLELDTPFGVFVVPNISPDNTAGIGGWSDLDFINAMKNGVSPDGAHYYPAFPYASYQRMRLTDLIDLKGFLDTLPASGNRAESHKLAFPYSIRRAVGVWKLLNWDGTTFEPDPEAGDLVNRGAYLVEGPGHCGECHTPRDLLGGMERSKWLAGAPEAEGDGFVPNITPHQTGIGDWTEADIVYAMESGFDPDFDSFGGSMVAVQENLAQLPAADREAIAAYLKAVPPLPTTPRPTSE